ncbi:hypothetical protein IPM65_02365 [Candidatus Roizmanbacteria bacterium]|nr:MAG: hypothetical protein IPM65_02365 [Candidatus Roizmanbacteria bacterium]
MTVLILLNPQDLVKKPSCPAASFGIETVASIVSSTTIVSPTLRMSVLAV